MTDPDASDILQLTQQQRNIASDIASLKSSYTKCARDKRTQEYISTKLSRLEALWEEFVTRHEEIFSYELDNKEHPYFTQDYYHQVERTYLETRSFFAKALSDLKAAKLAASQTDQAGEEQGATSSQTKEIKTGEPHTQQIKQLKQMNEHQVQEHSFCLSKQVKRQRAVMKRLSRLLDTIDDKQIIGHSEAYIKQKLKAIEDYWQVIISNHFEIMEEAAADEEESEETSAFIKLEDRYQDITVKLQEELTRIATAMTLNASHQPSKIKLPQVDIPQFDGNYLRWKSFHDLFNQLINNNNSIGPAQKMFYLKTKISGDASKLIQHLQIMDENYQLAWDLLCDRYNNTRLLVSNQLRTLLSQGSLTTESAEGIRRLHDTSKECISAIASLGINTENWDPIIVHILTEKLDKESHRLYEQSLQTPKELQSLQKFFTFLEGRFQTLQAIGDKGKGDVHSHNARIATSNQKSRKTDSSSKANSRSNLRGRVCEICKGNHSIYTCAQLKGTPSARKIDLVKKAGLCVNCLRSGHNLQACQSNRTCIVCAKRHHTLLHSNETSKPNTSRNMLTHTTTSEPQPSMNQQAIQANIQTHYGTQNNGNILLATAIVKTTARNGSTEYLRALVDQGSQASFITEATVQRLNLPKTKTMATIAGVGGVKAGVSNNKVQLTIRSRYPSNFQLTATFFVLPKLTQFLPVERVIENKWDHIDHLLLADPDYMNPGAIDIIFGADIFTDILLDGVLKGPRGTPMAQQTELGWILSGCIRRNQDPSLISCMITEVDIDNTLKRFWEIEEVEQDRKIPTQEEVECERHYSSTVRRLKSGRYEVRIPVKSQQIPLGNSKNKAVARLLQMERKFSSSKNLDTDYKSFMQEYLDLGHMTEAEPIVTGETYYLPHHAVIKKESTTTKLRVVFDASSKTTSGYSLNDKMMTGPTLQQDLTSTILRWRKFRIAYTADIEKMYRQVLLAKEDQNYHRIVWRQSPNEQIKEYQLTTVTYGTRAAPFLAVRTLMQLAEDEKARYPLASHVISRDFYVDDLMSGTDTEEEAFLMYSQLTEVMSKGGFKLRKWISNHEPFMRTIPEELRGVGSLPIYEEEAVKALGMRWNPVLDTFEFKVQLMESNKPPTKRTFLSEAAQIFDPLGWLAPITIQTKLMFQELWITGLSWDDPLPEQLSNKWTTFKKELSILTELKLPRWVNLTNQQPNIQLHGFCDASEKAYAAVIYIRTMTESSTHSHLLIAKTKVAPISKRLSIPKLELCGAVLLTKLISQVKRAMEINQATTYAWTDSTVVLAWLRKHPSYWKTFVANRVSEIQSAMSSSQWHYVKSVENPADLATRGTHTRDLLSHTAWWSGPSWLQGKELPTNNKPNVLDTKEEARKTSILSAMNTTTTTCQGEWIEKYSTLTTLTRVAAYCFRFSKNTRCRKNERLLGPLTALELNEAMTALIKIVQQCEFPNEIRTLTANKQLKEGNHLSSLNPFIDSKGVMRVGGRLQNADLSYEERHPAIMPYKHHFTTLIINMAHRNTLHGGTKLTLAYTRQRFWVLKGYSAVKQHIFRCITCYRNKPKPVEPLMGDLPKVRLIPKRAFNSSGVDYAGPIDLKIGKGRGYKTQKGYIVIFVCMVTRAVHIDAVTDLTAEAFLACFRRFVGRRGNVEHLYSDNATNFVKSSKILHGNLKTEAKQFQNTIYNTLLTSGTQWHFIPPSAPHVGGIWEAAVKSTKTHLRRVIGEVKLTYEELATFLVQIEACLNSRPYCPLTDDPDDLDVLTPGHFLIGTSLLAPPDKEYPEPEQNYLKRWQLVQRMQQHFWKRWSQEHLHHLQQRSKWRTRKNNIKVGELVLIKNEHLPPTRWPLARVKEIHHGKDNIVRVVTLKTKDGTLTRPVQKICPLPLDYKELEEVNPQEKTTKTITANTAILTQSEKPNRNSHNSITLLKLLLIALLIPTFLKGCTASPVNISPFKNNPGLYYEDLGQVSLVSNEWNLIIHHDLTNYWAEYEGIKGCVTRLTEVCQSTKSHRYYCEAILREFNYQLSQLEDNNKALYDRTGTRPSKSRNRRGAINIIGNIANTLFGILDHDYAVHVEQQIQESRKNEHLLLQLLKNQTSITESTTNIIKKTTQDIRQQFKTYDGYIEQITAELNNTIHEIREERIAQIFSSLAIYTTLIMLNFQKVQLSLINAVFDIYHGKINILMLTPDQLKQQISMIKMNLHPDINIPEGSTAELYHIMTAKTTVTKNSVICSVRLPLPNRRYYQLFKLIPLPTYHRDKFVFIQPSTKYLVVTLNRENYYPLTEDDFSRCNHIKTSKYLCHQDHPIYNRQSNNSKCEIDLLNHQGYIPKYCNVKEIKPSKIWIKLQRPNSWIYVLDEEHTFNVICNTTVTPIHLKGEGILTLQPSCMIKQTSMVIYAHNTQPSNTNASFIPAINLSLQLRNNNSRATPNPLQGPELHFKPSMEEIANIEEAIRELKLKETLPATLTTHDVHQYTTSYLTLVAIIFAAVIFLLKRYWRTNKSCLKETSNLQQKPSASSPPIPKPRRRLSLDADFVLQPNTAGEDV